MKSTGKLSGKMAEPISALLLAAGRGTRMGSEIPKPLVPLAGQELICHLINALQETGINEIGVVVGYQSEMIQAALGDKLSYVFQEQLLGTAHAVECAMDMVSQFDRVLIFVGDSPLIRPDSIRKLIETHVVTKSTCSFLTAVFEKEYHYARVIRNNNQQLIRCVEARDANRKELALSEYMSSHFIFNVNCLVEFLPQIKPHWETGERYLTDMINLLLAAGQKVSAVKIPDYRELVGLNTPEELAWAEQVLKERND